jgi:phosphatidylglycerophosphate synthase/putative flippase GtrA
MQAIASVLSGRLTASERVWSSLAPALALLALLLLGVVAYGLRTLIRGRFHDEEMDQRGLGGLTSARLRHFFAWLMRPLWRGLAAAEVPPNAITTLSVAFAMGAGFAAAAGRFALAGWVFLAAGAMDFLDGRVARATGRASRSGAALDSVLDRYCESALLVGLAWYYRDSWVLLPALLALTGSLLVPYVRARGEALGARLADVGFMQRPERIIALGASVAFAPIPEAIFAPNDPHPPHRLAIAGLVLLAATSHTTALQRLLYLVRDLSNEKLSRVRLVPRAILVSVLATLADSITVHALVSSFGFALPPATLLGCGVGAVVAFCMSRSWVFRATGGGVSRQLTRFAFVAATSALLNTGGVWLLALMPAIGQDVRWIMTRVLVFACWNFPLHSEWAFADDAAPDSDDAHRAMSDLGTTDLGGKSAADAS